jgi:hypothetical protein
VPVALAAGGGFSAYLRIAWPYFVDNSANGCCDGEIVQFVALFLADAATLLDYPVKHFPCSVASVADKECLTPPGRRDARAGRVGQESIECTRSRRDVHPTLHQLVCLRGRHGAREFGRMGQVSAMTGVGGHPDLITCKRTSAACGRLTGQRVRLTPPIFIFLDVR